MATNKQKLVEGRGSISTELSSSIRYNLKLASAMSKDQKEEAMSSHKDDPDDSPDSDRNGYRFGVALLPGTPPETSYRSNRTKLP